VRTPPINFELPIVSLLSSDSMRAASHVETTPAFPPYAILTTIAGEANPLSRCLSLKATTIVETGIF